MVVTFTTTFLWGGVPDIPDLPDIPSIPDMPGIDSEVIDTITVIPRDFFGIEVADQCDLYIQTSNEWSASTFDDMCYVNTTAEDLGNSASKMTCDGDGFWAITLQPILLV